MFLMKMLRFIKANTDNNSSEMMQDFTTSHLTVCGKGMNQGIKLSHRQQDLLCQIVCLMG